MPGSSASLTNHYTYAQRIWVSEWSKGWGMMPEGSRRTTASAPSRSALRVKWDNKRDEVRLLRLVKSNADYKVTFFPTGMVRRQQYKLGADLCVEFLQDDPDQIRDWRRRGLVEKGQGGIWKATKLWDSRVSNPITAKLRELKKSYELAQDKYGRRLDPAWNKFSEVPTAIRVDLVDICPFYFHLKPLFVKSLVVVDDDDHPPLRVPSPAAPRRALSKTGRPTRPIVGAPPSPPPSSSPEPRSEPAARPGPADAGPSNAVFALRPTRDRPSPAIGVSPAEQLNPTPAPLSSNRPISVSDSSARSSGPSSMSSSSTGLSGHSDSDHDMENDWVKHSDASDDEVPAVADWLNLRQPITPDTNPEQARRTTAGPSADASRAKRELSPLPSVGSAGTIAGRVKRARMQTATAEAPAKPADRPDTTKQQAAEARGRHSYVEHAASSLSARVTPTMLRDSVAYTPMPMTELAGMTVDEAWNTLSKASRFYDPIEPTSLRNKLRTAVTVWAPDSFHIVARPYMTPKELAKLEPLVGQQSLKRSRRLDRLRLRLINETFVELLETHPDILGCLKGFTLYVIPVEAPEKPKRAAAVQELINMAVRLGFVLCQSMLENRWRAASDRNKRVALQVQMIGDIHKRISSHYMRSPLNLAVIMALTGAT